MYFNLKERTESCYIGMHKKESHAGHHEPLKSYFAHFENWVYHSPSWETKDFKFHISDHSSFLQCVSLIFTYLNEWTWIFKDTVTVNVTIITLDNE